MKLKNIQYIQARPVFSHIVNLSPPKQNTISTHVCIATAFVTFRRLILCLQGKWRCWKCMLTFQGYRTNDHFHLDKLPNHLFIVPPQHFLSKTDPRGREQEWLAGGVE